MFKPHFGKCVCHGRERIIVVKAGLCKSGNEEKKRAAKNGCNRKIDSKENKKKTVEYLKKMIARKQRTPTGEIDLFRQIWEDRVHICEVSGESLTAFDVRCFSHVLSKGAFPGFRLNPDNIILITPCLHAEWEFKTRSHPRWILVLQKAEILKRQYHQQFHKIKKI